MREIWGIKNCQSVKKALLFLDEKGIAYNFVDYKKNPPSLALLKKWVEQKGLEVVLNKKGTTYRALGLKEKNLSKEELLKVMSENPTLIKRPILISEGVLEFGFSKEVYETLC